MKPWGSTYKFREVVIFARQQDSFFALHVFDRLLEEAILFGDDFVEDRDRLPALCCAFHARCHKRMIQGLRCCLSAGSTPFAVIVLFVGATVINKRERSPRNQESCT